MKKTSKKIGVIGIGIVGSSFLYAAINQGLASEYVLIDVNFNIATGNALDLADTLAVLPTPFTSIKAGDYPDLQDADLVVITAGRSQQGSLDMTAQDVMVMQEIGQKVKASGFEGISILATNPVDVMALVYQEAGGFDPHKVIGSGTTLDSARLRRLLGAKLGINPSSINAYILGEQHGVSSVAIWSQASVNGQPLANFLAKGTITNQDLKEIRNQAAQMAYQIIGLKKATFYGIGACLAKIAKSVLNDEKEVLMVGAKVEGQYATKGIYIGVPAIVSASGWEQILEWELSVEEQNLFLQSAKTIQEAVENAHQVIKVKT